MAVSQPRLDHGRSRRQSGVWVSCTGGRWLDPLLDSMSWQPRGDPDFGQEAGPWRLLVVIDKT